MSERGLDVADDVRWSDNIVPYDEACDVTYFRPLDADAEGVDWREVAWIVLHRDPVAERWRTRRCRKAHLKRQVDDKGRLPPDDLEAV